MTTKNASAKSKGVSPLLVLVIGVIFVAAVTGVYGYVLSRSFDAWGTRGSFGDSFGLANALFAGLAFVGLLATILLQHRDLALQREELERTRSELARAAEAQESVLRQQQTTRWFSEYLAVQSDFSSNMRTLIRSGSHAIIYDDLAKRGGSKFVAWDGYDVRDKTVYAYLELVYETFERVFVIKDRIDPSEWPYWEKWVDDVAGHPLMEHVYQDNEGMFDKSFETYFADRMQACKRRHTTA